MIRVGVVGGGWVTENRHLPALAVHPNCRISVIVSKKRENVRKLRSRFHIPYAYVGNATDNAQWLEYCDAVVIGTEPFSHYSVVKYCLERGKHVLVEKPFTVSVRESEELLSIAKVQKCKLAVVHNFQFSKSAQALERDISDGTLGTIKSLDAVQYGNPLRRLPSWYENLPWGLFFDESPHLLYLLEKFGGELSLQTASMVRSRKGKNTPDLVNALFLTAQDIPASLHLHFHASVSEWFLIVNGEERIGILDVFRDSYFSIPNDGKHTPWDILRTSLSVFYGHGFGVFRSGMRVISGTYLCGNDIVVDRFLRSVLFNEPLGNIDGQLGARINALQFELMEKALVF